MYILDEHITATVRACSLEVNGHSNRRLKICGTNGTVELCPLERFDGQPMTMRLSLKDAIPGYSSGTHALDFGIRKDRYTDQLEEFAGIIEGRLPDRTSFEHDYLVQDVLLSASGYTPWK